MIITKSLGAIDTLGHLYRLLLWRGTILHRAGLLMCTNVSGLGRWPYMVLGNGKYERQNSGVDGKRT